MKSWELTIKRGWSINLKFRFKKITEAEAFLNAFIEAKQPMEDDDKRGWEYSISPVMEDDKEPEEESNDHDE